MTGLSPQSVPRGLTPHSTVLPIATPDIQGDHHRRTGVGVGLAGLVLGVVIQGGPRRRRMVWLPRPPRADGGRRSAVSISGVVSSAALDQRGDVLQDPADPQLSRWENEGGRVVDRPLGWHRVSDLRTSA